MSVERIRIAFPYRIGEQVWIAERPESYRVVRQRYETREVMGPLTSYVIENESTGALVDGIVEADLSPEPRASPLRYHQPGKGDA